MKTKKRTRLTRFLFGFLPLLILASCVKETEYSPVTGGDGESMVKFAVQSPGAAAPQTRSITEAQENEVQTIDILVFQQATDGGNYVYTARCDAADITTGSDARLKTFTIKLRQGNFDLVILANARDLFIPSALSGLSKADALATLEAVMPSGGKWPTGSFTPFPMWGDVGPITIDDNTDLTGTNKVKINRMVARVDVNVTGTAATNFQLTSVDVYNYNTAGTLVPDMTAWDTTDPDKPYATAPNVPASSVLTLGPIEYYGTEINTVLNNCIREIYLFETENHTDALHSTAKGLKDRTCLVIGGIWDANGDGDFTNDGPATYYRVDFSTGKGTAQTFIDVNRNHQYVFNVSKVSGYGYDDSQTAFESAPINIETEVLQWNEADMEDFVDDGQYFYSLSPMKREHWAAISTGNVLRYKSNYPTWTFEISDNRAPGAGTKPTWLNVTNHTEGAVINGDPTGLDIEYDVAQNSDGVTRTAYIHLKTGRWIITAQIVQHAWNIDRIYISPLDDIPSAGGIRTITVEGLYDDIDIQAWDVTANLLIYSATIPSNQVSGIYESQSLVIPQLWHPVNSALPYERTIAFRYWSSEDNDWRVIRTQDQEGYYITSAKVTAASISLNGGSATIAIEGNHPNITIQAITGGTVLSSNTISAGTSGTATVSFSNVNASLNARTIIYGYTHPGNNTWIQLGSHNQAHGGIHVGNNIYVYAQEFGPTQFTNANCPSNWSQPDNTQYDAYLRNYTTVDRTYWAKVTDGAVARTMRRLSSGGFYYELKPVTYSYYYRCIR